MLKRIIAAAIIILIAFAFVQWGMDAIYAYGWDKDSPVRESLTNEIQNTKMIIDQPVDFDETLVLRLAELRDQIDLEASKFPDSVYVTDVVNDLLHLAEDAGIHIIPLRNGEWTNSRQEGYQMYMIQLLVEGDVDDIVYFVDQVERTMLYSINIEQMDIKGIIGSEDSTSEDTETVDGYVTITIYKRT